MDISYFLSTKEFWINNRLDISDAWNMIDKREKVTLWCLDTSTRESLKRKRDEHGDDDDTPPLKKKSPAQGTVEERKARAKENEEKLKELHKDRWTSFQYKLWAEMLIHGTHSSFEEPPNASTFALNRRRSSVQDNTVSGYLSLIHI